MAKKDTQSKRENTTPVNDSISNTYKYTTFDSIKLGFTDKYMLAYATFLNATPFQFSLLSAFPQFVGGIVQLFMGFFLKVFKSRKGIVIGVTILQAFVWAPVIYITFYQNQYTTWIYVGIVTLYMVLNLISNPIWSSWIFDIVDPDNRGKFIAIKNKVTDTVSFLAFISGGLILNRARLSGNALDWSFAALFIIAIVSNLISARYAKRIHEPYYRYVRPKISLAKFIASMRSDSQGNIVLYMTMMSFAIYVASAFYTPYLLNTVGFTYLEYAILIAMPFLVRIVFARRFGKIIDKYGPKRMLRIGSFCMAIIPLLWVVDSSFVWLVLVQLYSGISFSSYEISALAFLINQTNNKNRVSLLSYYNFFNGFFILAGSLSALLLMQIGPFETNYLNAFFFSGVFRILILFIRFPKKVKEKDHYVPASYHDLSMQIFAIDSTKDFLGRMVIAKEVLALRPVERNDIVTKLGNGGYLKIKKQNNIITNYTPKLPKKKTVDTKKPSHYIYMCRSCNAEFKRYVHSTTNLKCPYCESKNLIFMRNEYRVSVYSGKK